MATEQAIDALYESTLRPRLAALEGHRRALRGYIAKAGACFFVPFAAFILADWIARLTGLPSIAIAVLAVIGMFAGVAVAGFTFLVPGVAAYMNYRTRFKQEVAAEVFRIVCPTATYAPEQGVAEAVFDEPGIFNTRGAYHSDDRVRGTIGATTFEAADVSRTYRTGGKNSHRVVVFRGLFFHLDFPTRLAGTTIVQAAQGSARTLSSREGFRPVEVEEPAFAKAFEVYATDEAEAHRLLTPSLQRRILSLAARTDKPIYLGFKGSRAYLGVHYDRALFEPGVAATTSVEAIREMAAHFALAEAVVQELDLSAGRPREPADPAIFGGPDAAPDAIEALATSGDVTPAALWAAATKEAGGTDDGAELAPQPPGTAIRIEHAGGRTEVRYSLSAGFFIAVALSLASGAVTLAAARVLPAALGRPALERWTSWIPDIPYVPAAVSEWPVPSGIAALVLLGVSLLVWGLRVRRVSVERDAVCISRGVRPWPRAYPRPLYGKIVRLDTAVFLAKGDGFSLVNVSASPMLTEAEARWVAAELRRALRTTAH